MNSFLNKHSHFYAPSFLKDINKTKGLILLNLEFKVNFRIKRTKSEKKDQNITIDIIKIYRSELNLVTITNYE